MFFKKKDKQLIIANMNSLHHQTRDSFASVKKDTNLIFQWLNFFYQKSMHQEHMISNLSREIESMPKSIEEIKKVIDTYYNFESLSSRLLSVEQKLGEFSRNSNVISAKSDGSEKLEELKHRLEKLESKKQNMRERIIKRVTKNSRDYVKSVIVSLIKRYEKVSGLQLKEMVVEDQGLCSKSSFYRMLSEIEESSSVEVVRKGKEKYYFNRLTQSQNLG